MAFFKAEHGVYHSGSAARNNPGEAIAVARRVIHHFRTRPNRSLGVVALSQSQAEVIREAVELERGRNPTWTSASPTTAWTASSSKTSKRCRATSAM
ncbi:hypothetical protein H4K36_01045 [Streptomyces sp. DHE7-1]|nr:hypothetical protein [Streptomyces sp. DHE7-1]